DRTDRLRPGPSVRLRMPTQCHAWWIPDGRSTVTAVDARWMIYGANGYTGRLVARLAVARGDRPLLAGRDAAAVGRLAAELGLDYRAVDLADAGGLRAALGGVGAVAHCAGPVMGTSAPLVGAWLA